MQVDIYASGCGYKVSGAGGGGYVRPTPSEQHFLIHCDSSNIGAVYVGGLVARSVGVMDDK